MPPKDLVQSSLTGLFPLLLSVKTHSSVHFVSQSALNTLSLISQQYRMKKCKQICCRHETLVFNTTVPRSLISTKYWGFLCKFLLLLLCISFCSLRLNSPRTFWNSWMKGIQQRQELDLILPSKTVLSSPQQLLSPQIQNWHSFHYNLANSPFSVLSFLKHCLETSACESPCLSNKCAEPCWRDFLRILSRME